MPISTKEFNDAINNGADAGVKSLLLKFLEESKTAPDAEFCAAKYAFFIKRAFEHFLVNVTGEKQFIFLRCKVRGKLADGSECTGIITANGPFYVADAGWPAQQWDGEYDGECPSGLIPTSPEIVEILGASLDTSPRR